MNYYKALKTAKEPLNPLYLHEPKRKSLNRTEEEREYYDDAQICLNCTKKKCRGGEDCFQKQKAKRGGVR